MKPLEEKLEGLPKSRKNPEAGKVRDQIKQIALTDPGAPPRAMVVADNDTPTEPRILPAAIPQLPASRSSGNSCWRFSARRGSRSRRAAGAWNWTRPSPRRPIR